MPPVVPSAGPPYELYKAEYRHARVSFSANWDYIGLEHAFKQLWRVFTYYKLTSRLSEDPAQRREFYILSCAQWSLYNELVQRYPDIYPDEDIPF